MESALAKSAAQRRQWNSVALLLLLTFALISTVTGMPLGGPKKHSCGPGRKSHTVPGDQNELRFAGGSGFGQQSGQVAERAQGKLTDDKRRIVPQSTTGTGARDPANAEQNKVPSSNKLETTTESRSVIGAPTNECKDGQMKNKLRQCVDAKEAPE